MRYLHGDARHGDKCSVSFRMHNTICIQIQLSTHIHNTSMCLLTRINPLRIKGRVKGV